MQTDKNDLTLEKYKLVTRQFQTHSEGLLEHVKKLAGYSSLPRGGKSISRPERKL